MSNTPRVRRPLAGRIAAGILGGAALLVPAAGIASAEPPPPPPGCTVADMTGVETGVAAAMSAYLWTHPNVNAFFTGVQGLPKDQAFTQIKDYLTANPQVKAEMDAIQGPADALRARCGIAPETIIRGVL